MRKMGAILLALLMLVGCTHPGAPVPPSRDEVAAPVSGQEPVPADQAGEGTGEPDEPASAEAEEAPATSPQQQEKQPEQEPDPAPAVSPPTPYLEQLRLGQRPEEVRAILGKPERVVAKGERMETWEYNRIGLSLTFSPDLSKLRALELDEIEQTRGQLPNGLAIGDPEEKVRELGVKIHGYGENRVALLEHADGELYVYINGDGVITRFRLKWPSDPAPVLPPTPEIDPQIAKERGIQLFHAGHYLEALEHLWEARRYIGDAETLKYYALTTERLYLRYRAAHTFEEALAANPDDPELLKEVERLEKGVYLLFESDINGNGIEDSFTLETDTDYLRVNFPGSRASWWLGAYPNARRAEVRFEDVGMDLPAVRIRFWHSDTEIPSEESLRIWDDLSPRYRSLRTLVKVWDPFHLRIEDQTVYIVTPGGAEVELALQDEALQVHAVHQYPSDPEQVARIVLWALERDYFQEQIFTAFTAPEFTDLYPVSLPFRSTLDDTQVTAHSDKEATVVGTLYSSDHKDYYRLNLHLTRVEGQWKVDAITCLDADICQYPSPPAEG